MLDGTWKKVSDKETASRNYWWGLSAGVENLICSSQMPYGTKRLVDTFQSLITEGHFHWNKDRISDYIRQQKSYLWRRQGQVPQLLLLAFLLRACFMTKTAENTAKRTQY